MRVSSFHFCFHEVLTQSVGSDQCLCCLEVPTQSVGDDQCLQVWHMANFKCMQTLHSAKWRQVTALTWVTISPATDSMGMVVCVGTGTVMHTAGGRR